MGIAADRPSARKRQMGTFVQSVSETGYLILVYQRWRTLVKFFF